MDEPIKQDTLVGGRWRITGLIGQGGFGQVYRARDETPVSLGEAAVKILHPNTSPNERYQFLAEVQKIASLRHPNLVGYLDSGQLESGGDIHPYLVTERMGQSTTDSRGRARGSTQQADLGRPRPTRSTLASAF